MAAKWFKSLDTNSRPFAALRPRENTQWPQSYEYFQRFLIFLISIEMENKPIHLSLKKTIVVG